MINRFIFTFFIITLFTSCSKEFEYIVLDDGTIEITKYNKKKKEVVIPKYIDSLKVTRIGDYAFLSEKLRLKEVTIPNSIVSIGEGAFEGNNLREIYIPNSVTSIGKLSFADNRLEKITLPNSVTNIGDYAFSGNRLEKITLPNSVVSIGKSAFAYSYFLNDEYEYEDDIITDEPIEIFVPSSIKKIGIYTLEDREK